MQEALTRSSPKADVGSTSKATRGAYATAWVKGGFGQAGRCSDCEKEGVQRWDPEAGLTRHRFRRLGRLYRLS